MNVRLSGADAPDAAGVDAAALGRAGERLLAALDLRGAELSVALVGEAAMAELNARWRGREGPTDVLSFSLLEGEGAEHRGGLLGDVVLCVPVAVRQAAARGHGVDEELLRLLVHGTLHLLGHDHQHDDEAAVMEAEERRLWQVLHAG
ncbi:MAG: rRNA maturation RNase YbeY [Myxococcota bacterium]|nr:rRNA maturation RNase YbeY [Myxococcota bacterium]